MHSGPLTLTAAYKPPDSPLLEDDMNLILRNNNFPKIIAGDLNCKYPSWNSRIINTNGRRLYKYMNNNPSIAIMGPTELTHYPPNRTPDVLDIIVQQDVYLQLQLTTINDLSSHHQPVLLEVGSGPNKNPEAKSFINWEQFTYKIEKTIGPITPIEQPNEIETRISALQDKIIDTIQYSSKPAEASHPDKLPTRIIEIIKAKNRTRKR